MAHEEAGRASLVEVDRATYEAHELRHARLEEFIARPSLEHCEHGLTVVARRVEPERCDDLVHLTPHQGDLCRCSEISGRRPKAEEAVLTHHPAAPVVLADGDLVEMTGAMHRGAAVRFGDVQRSVVGGCGRIVGACLAEDPEAAACDAAHPALSQSQMLVALEDEVRAVHPIEQRDRFLAVAGGPGSATAFVSSGGLDQGACGVAHAFAHRSPILDGGLDIRQSGV